MDGSWAAVEAVASNAHGFCVDLSLSLFFYFSFFWLGSQDSHLVQFLLDR